MQVVVVEYTPNLTLLNMAFYRYLLITLAVCSTVVLSDDDHGSHSISYTKEDFSEQIASKPHFVMFFAPWCGHCKRLAPTWDKLAQKYNSEDEAFIAKVDCTKETELCSDNGVTGYPTLKFFKDGNEAVKYKGSRDFDALNKHVMQQLGASAEEETTEEAASAVKVLTDANFAGHIETGRHFIKFYAPWCPHCQHMVAAWDQLADIYNTGSEVTIAKVDCTQHGSACSQQGVGGYPTLLWFEYGKKEEKYSGGRDFDSLKGYVEKMKTKQDPNKFETEEQIPEEASDEIEDDVDYVHKLSAETFDEHVSSGYHFVKFFAPWCGHCRSMAKDWEKLAEHYVDDTDVSICEVDCTKHMDLCTNKHDVKGYPTLLWFKDGKKLEKYQGARDVDSFKNFVQGKVGRDSEEGEQEGAVVQLGTDTFTNFIEEKPTVFVKFFAPWCGHCKRLAPTWEELGEKFKSSSNVFIAKVDCTQHREVCTKEGVHGYPSLKLYQKGSAKEEYNGGRDLDSLNTFVTKSVSHDEL